MKPEINEILNELYENDKSLKNKEKELINVISKMMDSKPNSKIDNDFKRELKTKVLNQMNNKSTSFFNLASLKYLLTFVSGIAVVWLFINIYPDLFNKTTDILVPNTDEKSINLSFSPKIEKLEQDNAFGKLKIDKNSQITDRELAAKAVNAWVSPESISSRQLWWWASSVNTTTSSANPSASSDAVINNPSTSPKVSTSMAMTEPAIDSKMSMLPYPDYKPKTYTYNLKQWVSLPEIPANMYVYKNQNTDIKTNSSNLSDILKTDIIDFSKLDNLGLSYLSIYEDQKDGYQLDVSLAEWSINIYRNYRKWQEVDYSNQKQLSLNDIPSDDKVIWIVDDFTKKYSINLDSYSKPVVNNSWKKYYEMSTDKQNYYIPDVVSVIYQFNVDGIWVYESYGNPIWLETTVNVRDMKVNSLWPIQKMDLKWSKYDLMTSSWEILDIAKKWQNNNVYMDATVKNEAWVREWSSGSEWTVATWATLDAPSSMPAQAPVEPEEINVEIWNPQIVYLRQYIYNEQTQTSEQYFVPGMRFDVLTPSDDAKMIYPGETVTVPLVKDFLNTNTNIVSPMVR